MKRSWKVYGREGHRQKASFGSSMNFDTWSGCHVEVETVDKTGTNDYVIVRITADTSEACETELWAQISDGIFENCSFGKIEEVN